MAQSLSTTRQTPPAKSLARCPISQTTCSTSSPNLAPKIFPPLEAHDAKCPVTQFSNPVFSKSSFSNQLGVLSITRTISSIPRAPNSSYDYNVDVDANSHCDAGEYICVFDFWKLLNCVPGFLDTGKSKSRWEYPSPQQFHNALLRKGWKFPEEHMEPMVQLHNRLNEDAWREILKWESRNHGGYGCGTMYCSLW